MENVTREFENAVDGYIVMYDDAADEYNVLNVEDDFFCELNTQEYADVVEFFNFIQNFKEVMYYEKNR